MLSSHNILSPANGYPLAVRRKTWSWEFIT